MGCPLQSCHWPHGWGSPWWTHHGNTEEPRAEILEDNLPGSYKTRISNVCQVRIVNRILLRVVDAIIIHVHDFTYVLSDINDHYSWKVKMNSWSIKWLNPNITSVAFGMLLLHALNYVSSSHSDDGEMIFCLYLARYTFSIFIDGSLHKYSECKTAIICFVTTLKHYLILQVDHRQPTCRQIVPIWEYEPQLRPAPHQQGSWCPWKADHRHDRGGRIWTGRLRTIDPDTARFSQASRGI